MPVVCNENNKVLQAEINEIYDIYNLKMSQLEVEREQEIENLKKNYERDQAVEKIREAAFRQKTKLDALVEAGFSKKEAMDMVMKLLEKCEVTKHADNV